jgi:3,5-epimerase/4-reductase
MKWLVYGSQGWIGPQIVSIITKNGDEVINGQSRVDNYDQTFEEINLIGPDRVLCATGRTSGPGCPNIDYLEQPGKLVDNLRDNLSGPINLALICQRLNIHFSYLGTGCIYEYDDAHPMLPSGAGFTESDFPNFTGSQYSAVKGTTDQILNHMKGVMNARIRMPISDQIHPRNFITKISQYKKVISIPNSMTVLSEMLPLMVDLARNCFTGPINLCNPGTITHKEILELYQQYVDPAFTFEVMDLDELGNHVVGRRSNNYLDTTLLEQNYPNVRSIQAAVRETLITMGQQKRA